MTNDPQTTFQKGDRVRFSDAGKRWLHHNNMNLEVEGTINATPRKKDTVAVIRDGHVTPDYFHQSFVEKI